MRFSYRLTASLALLTPLFAFAEQAGPQPQNHDGQVAVAEGVPAAPPAAAPAPAPAPAATTTAAAGVDSSTVFNGVEVPPIRDLKASNFEKTTQKGYHLIKYFSPLCVHCKRFAPTWQTAYEFYHTSKPVTGSSKEEDATTSLNSFERYYDFHFENVNCIISGDMCSDHKVDSYPTVVLYKDGVEVKREVGAQSMAVLGGIIEEQLEKIKPGSRPIGGINYPEPGANSAPAQPSATVPGTVPGAVARATGTVMAASPTSTPNEAGTSLELDPESFQKLVTLSRDPWFIKFYAPWCHHCQAMAPNWNSMARELQGQLNIGSVNCDLHRRLCQDLHVKAYPTIHFFRGGERVEYSGLRGQGDLISYAKKAVDIGKGVDYVTADGLKKLEETEEVIFVYFFDQATTSEDFAALDRLTLSLVGHAKLVKTDSAQLADRFKIHTWPKLLVVRDERPSYFNSLAPRDMRDFRMVLTWMQQNWLPLVPELEVSNAHEIMDGHLVVLGVLSRDRPNEFQLNRKEMKNAARDWMDRETRAFQAERQELRDSKQLRIEEADDRGDKRALRDAKNIRIQITEEGRRQVRFAWVDGLLWERWIRTTYGVQIKEGERVVIIDEDTKRYWDQTITGEPIRPSRTSIMETLQKITADPPKIAPKYTTNKVAMVFLELKRLSRKHPWLATIVFIGALFFAATWGRGRIRRSRSGTGSFHILGEKDGLFGGGANGKSD